VQGEAGLQSPESRGTVRSEGHVVADEEFHKFVNRVNRGELTSNSTKCEIAMTILVVEARGHMASDWHFADLHIGGVKGI
jgi:hypothetical protein